MVGVVLGGYGSVVRVSYHSDCHQAGSPDGRVFNLDAGSIVGAVWGLRGAAGCDPPFHTPRLCRSRAEAVPGEVGGGHGGHDNK
jgi:hypothetical protein